MRPTTPCNDTAGRAAQLHGRRSPARRTTAHLILGALLAGAGLSACGGGGGDDGPPAPTRTLAPATPTAVATQTATTGATQTPTSVAATQTPTAAAATQTPTAGQNTPEPTSTQPATFERRALLDSYAMGVVLPALREFVDDAAALRDASQALASDTQSAAELDAARAAWRQAMRTWQALELMQVGPAGSPTMVMGGQGLRDEIYSWPTVNPCRVDQETVSGDFQDEDFFSAELVNTRGLDAIEYLLFDADQTNACNATVDINANGSWNALVGSGGLAARRAAYAAAAAADVAGHAIELRDAWEPNRGDFAGELIDAGLGGSQFPTAQDAINDVFAGLFYVELRVKDRKLAAPAGISPDCTDAVCPNLRESLWANASKDHLLANLAATERIFLGGDEAAVGFDDFLVSVGAGALAADMLADLRTAIAVTEAIPGTLADALASDPDAVRDAHAAVKTFTDELKSQFVTVLNLKIPQEGAGDND